MKKYLLTALLWVFAFVGFTNATWQSDCEISQCSFTVDWDWWYQYKISTNVPDNVNLRFNYSPTNLYVWPSDWSISCSDWLCSVDWLYDFNNFLWFSFYSDDEYTEEYSSTVSFLNCVYVSDECTLTWVENSGGWSSAWSSSNTPLLSGWISQLTPVVTGIKSVVVEFIPYVVYVSIWILLATLGFIVIKRLMNWMSKKITWTFSSRRRK